MEEWWSRPNQSVSSLIGGDAVVTSSDRSREARACRKGNGSKMIDSTGGLSGALCFHLEFSDVQFCISCLATNLCVIVLNHYCFVPCVLTKFLILYEISFFLILFIKLPFRPHETLQRVLPKLK